MSKAEIQRVIPEFKENYYSKVTGNEDIQVAKDMSGGSLQAIYIELASDLTKTSSFLQQQWGKTSMRKKGSVRN